MPENKKKKFLFVIIQLPVTKSEMGLIQYDNLKKATNTGVLFNKKRISRIVWLFLPVGGLSCILVLGLGCTLVWEPCHRPEN
jgi:hypothetical protein